MAASGPNIVTTGLVLCLDAANKKSYAGSGTTWTDLSISGNNGTSTGATFNSGNKGSFSFDGDDDYISLGETFTMDSDDATLMWWMAPSSATTDYNLFGASSNTGVLKLIEFRQTFFYAESNNNCGYFNSPAFTAWSNNEWHHVTVRFLGDRAYWYIDGNSIGETEDYGTIDCGATVLNDLGQYNTTLGYFGSGGYSNRYTGLLNDIMLYNRGLSNTEILQNYNALKRRFE